MALDRLLDLLAHRFLCFMSIFLFFSYSYVRQTKLASFLANFWAHNKAVFDLIWFRLLNPALFVRLHTSWLTSLVIVVLSHASCFQFTKSHNRRTRDMRQTLFNMQWIAPTHYRKGILKEFWELHYLLPFPCIWNSCCKIGILTAQLKLHKSI